MYINCITVELNETMFLGLREVKVERVFFFDSRS